MKEIQSILVREYGYIYGEDKVSDDFLPRYKITVEKNGWLLCEGKNETFCVNPHYIVLIVYKK